MGIIAMARSHQHWSTDYSFAKVGRERNDDDVPLVGFKFYSVAGN